MPNDLLTLDSIFNNRLFRIPDYQRGYAWGLKQIKDFWDDLDHLKDTKKHYTGQITVEKIPLNDWQLWDDDKWLIEGAGFNPYYIVDGQQRLTTAIILLQCILNKTDDKATLAYVEKGDHLKKYLFRSSEISKSYLFGYAKDNPSYEYLKTHIFSHRSNQDEGTLTCYTANLSAARNFFTKKLSSATHEDLDRWFKSLTQRMLFNWYELAEELDVFVVFETMNYRGKALTKLELLKNRLIYLSTLIKAEEQDKKSLRKNINDAWKTIYEYLGKRPDQRLDDDSFLRAHWIMYFGYDKSKAPRFGEDLLENIFSTSKAYSEEISVQAIQRYIDSIQNSVKKWYNIHFPSSSLPYSALRDHLEGLSRLGRGAFPALLMAAQQQNTDSDCCELIQQAERFIFSVSALCKRRSNTGDSHFYWLAHQVHMEKKTVKEASVSVSDKTSQFFSLDKAIAEMQDEGAGFYSWKWRYYLHFEYEQEMRRSACMESEKLDWEEFKKTKTDFHTIEHIYPQTAIEDDWPSFQNISTEGRFRLLNSLGNHLALSRGRNSRLSNRPFNRKCGDDGEIRGYSNGSYSEIAVSKEPDWTPQSIKDRGLRMLNFIEKRWALDLGDESQKIRILNLEKI